MEMSLFGECLVFFQEHLPALKTEVREKQEKVNRELARIGDGLPSSRGEMMMVLTKVGIFLCIYQMLNKNYV